MDADRTLVGRRRSYAARTRALGRAARSAAVRRAAAVTVLACLALACGQQFELPPQPDPIRIPEEGTYNWHTEWQLPSPSDIIVFDTYLYVIEEHRRVGAYYTKRMDPDPSEFVTEFEGLLHPVQLALSRGAQTHLVVADSGDMRCKIYSWQGGAPLSSFTDSAWVTFSGLAADESLRVYVADAVRDTIQAYDAQGAPLRVVSDFGTGSGFVIDPHGLAYTPTPGGEPVLLVADTGKHWVQRLRPDTSNVAAILDPIGLTEGELAAPQDVAADPFGEFIYVADTEHHQVLKYLRTGAFEDTVYSADKIIEVDPPLAYPRYLCSTDSLVFVSDPEGDRVVVLRLVAQ